MAAGSVGKWKLVSAQEDHHAWELFDLGRDRGEVFNLAARHPSRVLEMEAQWKQLEAEFRRQARPPDSGR